MKLFNLCGINREAPYSPYAWRVYFCLLHRRLDFEVESIRFLEKEKLAHAPRSTIPVLEDGDQVISDSFEIANYLEATYPEPGLFGGAVARAQAVIFNNYLDSTVLMGIFPHIVLDVLGQQDTKNAAYFRQTREQRLGMSLEDYHVTRGSDLKVLHKALDPFRAGLTAHPYLSGDRPYWLDYALMGTFMWAHVVSDKKLLDEDDPVYHWRERMFDLFDGAGRNAPRAVI